MRNPGFKSVIVDRNRATHFRQWPACVASLPLFASIKSECLNKLVLLGERHLRWAVSEFVEHYHLERNHQGLDNRLLTAPVSPANNNEPVERRERLGGLLNYYYRRAA